PGMDLSPSGERLAAKMGWVRRQDEKDADYNWLLEGKSKDQDGRNATYLPYSNIFAFSFNRWKREGGAVDKNGKVVPADRVQSLTEDAMRKEALVTPPTWYFEKPEEEYAEGVKLFRLGDGARKDLQKDSPTLYAIIKENDQAEIDSAFGKKS